MTNRREVKLMPILKDFDLNLEYIPNEKIIKNIMESNGWEYSKASDYDYNENWHEKISSFSFQTRCIASLYRRNLEKFKTDDCWKILVKCVKEITDSKIRTGGVCELQVVYDADEFFALSNYDKKVTTLRILKQGIDLVAEEKHWDKEPFDIAYNKVIECDYVNKWIWKKTKYNPSKKLIAKIYGEHDVDSVDISLVILNRKGEELKRVKIISTLPDELCYSIHLGELRWVSDSEVSLVNIFNTKQWSVKL
jgi:hypothetical protein